MLFHFHFFIVIIFDTNDEHTVYWFMNMIILSRVRIAEAGYNVKHGPNTSESIVVTWLIYVT